MSVLYFLYFGRYLKFRSGDLKSCPTSGLVHCGGYSKSFKIFVLGFLIMANLEG